MQVQVNTDHNIQGREALTQRVTRAVLESLSRFSERVTRVEVHLTDESAGKSGPHEQRCVMEARLEGVQPLAATHTATTLDEAVSGAAAKLQRVIQAHQGRERDRRPGFVDKSADSAGAEPAEQ